MAMRNIRKEIDEQLHWIEHHGGNLAGYIARYGSKDDSTHYGDGGEAIFAADTNSFFRLLSEAKFSRKENKQL